MKIVFMGTPEFAACALEALIKTDNEIGYVISQPDKMKNRGKKLQPTPVKEVAEANGLKVLQPEKIKSDRETIELLKEYAPDVMVVAAYGQILSKEILDIPRCGCVNIHGSLLPKYRGAAPIQRAIIEGAKETGVTLMYMAEGMDTGDMIAKVTTEVGRKTVQEMYDELAQKGAELLIDTLPDIESGKAGEQAVPQEDSRATYAPMLFKQDGEIDFSKSPEETERLIRGFQGAYTFLGGEMFKIWWADVSDEQNTAPAGSITKITKDGIEVSAGGKTLILKEVQAAGKKRMAVADYQRGAALKEGTVFGKTGGAD